MNLIKFYEVIDKIETHGGLGMRTPNGTSRMIYGLTKAIDAKVYVDVGTFVGLTCLWAARAMEENGGNGKVYTVELDSKWLEMAIQFAKDAGLAHRIEFVLSDSRNFLPLLPVEKIDLALLDSGDKDLYQTDFENIEDKITNDTIILAHDVIEQDKVPFHSAWKFKEYIDTRKEYNSFLIPQEYGTLIIRKK